MYRHRATWNSDTGFKAFAGAQGQVFLLPPRNGLASEQYIPGQIDLAGQPGGTTAVGMEFSHQAC
jgi:hypothetical protein